MYRPSPLVRAYCLEKKLDTPAKIYYKFEGNNTSGSHTLNSAIAQAYYAKKQGLKGVTTETGAGQWGTALSMACAYLELECHVYMVKCSYEQKPFRREVMRTYGAQVTPSPSETTEVGRKILREFPETSGSLGCAISEAVEAAGAKPGYRYVLGSVLNQVLLHQSVIGLETKANKRKSWLRHFRGSGGSRCKAGIPLCVGKRTKSGASSPVCDWTGNKGGGSLGCAISEAVEAAGAKPGYRYVLGSVLNQVLLHQSVIGLETKAALDKYGIVPDMIIGCAGGGSNLGGLISPFMGEKIRGERDYQFLAVEPASCPSLTRGKFAYDYCDTGMVTPLAKMCTLGSGFIPSASHSGGLRYHGMNPSLTRGKFAYDYCDTGMVTPLAKMCTLGSGFIPSASHSGGLRYHGMNPVLSQLYADGLMEARSVTQTEVFEAAQQFAKVEGILPAPESSHAIRAAIDEALKCKETGEEKTIVFGLTGTGYFDMVAYGKYNDGEMSDYIPADEELEKGFAGLPEI